MLKSNILMSMQRDLKIGSLSEAALDKDFGKTTQVKFDGVLFESTLEEFANITSKDLENCIEDKKNKEELEKYEVSPDSFILLIQQCK
jgi:hypothetical protein